MFLFFVFYLVAACFLKTLRSLRDNRNFNNKNSLNFNRYENKTIITTVLRPPNMLLDDKRLFPFLSLDSSEDGDSKEPVADSQHYLSGLFWSLPKREQCAQGAGSDCWGQLQHRQWLPQ